MIKLLYSARLFSSQQCQLNSSSDCKIWLLDSSSSFSVSNNSLEKEKNKDKGDIATCRYPSLESIFERFFNNIHDLFGGWK